MTLRGLIHRGIFQFSATSVIFYNILPCGIMAIFDKTETFQQYCFGLRPDRGGVPRGPRGRSSPARWVGAGLRRQVKKKKKAKQTILFHQAALGMQHYSQKLENMNIFSGQFTSETTKSNMNSHASN